LCTHPLSEKYAIFLIHDLCVIRKILKKSHSYCRKHIFKLRCTNIVCRLAPPGPAVGAYSALLDPLDAFDGPTSKTVEGKVGRKGEMLRAAYENFLATPLQ